VPDSPPSCRLHFGTCAWSHDDWRGVFYPDHLPSAERLQFYSHYFKTVEVDSTFYHPPTRAVTQHWADITPADFVFACKLPREITHDHRLRDCEKLLADFLEGLEPLQAKVGAIIIELPAWVDTHHDEHALRDFVRQLPASWPWAIEFRHEGWLHPHTVHLLEKHNVSNVWSDLTPLAGANGAAFDLHPPSADFAVIRLLGDPASRYHPDGSQSHHYTKLQWPRSESLENWAAKIRLHQHDLKRILIFAGDHFEGYAPVTIQRLAKLFEVEIQLPQSALLHPEDDSHQRQMKLWE